jgi:hypothetical protein
MLQPAHMLNKDIRSLILLSINTPKPTKGLDVFQTRKIKEYWLASGVLLLTFRIALTELHPSYGFEYKGLDSESPDND